MLHLRIIQTSELKLKKKIMQKYPEVIGANLSNPLNFSSFWSQMGKICKSTFRHQQRNKQTNKQTLTSTEQINQVSTIVVIINHIPTNSRDYNIMPGNSCTNQWQEYLTRVIAQHRVNKYERIAQPGFERETRIRFPSSFLTCS